MVKNVLCKEEAAEMSRLCHSVSSHNLVLAMKLEETISDHLSVVIVYMYDYPMCALQSFNILYHTVHLKSRRYSGNATKKLRPAVVGGQ